MDDETFVQCRCGEEWSMDCDPSPYDCRDHDWRLKLGEEGEWGPFIDPDGYPA